ncbi:MAG: hypothetical protein JW822_13495 [Spirochaetales bacterium]|nr:hypothetical protein [Spirochaetales bacterium]
MKPETAEIMRIKYLYRRLLLKGKIKLPLETARKLVGPDCVYHFYYTGT